MKYENKRDPELMEFIKDNAHLRRIERTKYLLRVARRKHYLQRMLMLKYFVRTRKPEFSGYDLSIRELDEFGPYDA
tara:strand:- start:286 stop:513 length:228 start_codon:yes stop_codon:yes gene_type:complete